MKIIYRLYGFLKYRFSEQIYCSKEMALKNNNSLLAKLQLTSMGLQQTSQSSTYRCWGTEVSINMEISSQQYGH